MDLGSGPAPATATTNSPSVPSRSGTTRRREITGGRGSPPMPVAPPRFPPSDVRSDTGTSAAPGASDPTTQAGTAGTHRRPGRPQQRRTAMS